VDLNNKQAWCEEYGEKIERSFCVDRLYDIGLTGFINLEKKKNIYAHDMFTVFQSDLKTVRTPFFKAWEKFEIDPQYAVTINMKDMQRYKELYPNIVVVFDVLWDEKICKKFIEGVEYEVKPMHQTYAGFIQDIRSAVVACGNKKVEYQGRVNDTGGNAKASYVFDVRKLQQLG
jgi:hypothetical protein